MTLVDDQKQKLLLKKLQFRSIYSIGWFSYKFGVYSFSIGGSGYQSFLISDDNMANYF